jgi:hypothetical protein
MWDVIQCGEETYIGAWNVSNALEQAAAFVAKTSGPKWLETGILHKSRVFHFFAGNWVDDRVGVVPLCPMVISEANRHMGCVHSAKVILGQVAWRELPGSSGHPRR